MKENIKKTIEEAVPNAEVHIGSEDDVHFSALVISSAFEGLPLVRQHQMVMKALEREFEEKVHALQLKTFTPQGWEEARNNYNL